MYLHLQCVLTLLIAWAVSGVLVMGALQDQALVKRAERLFWPWLVERGSHPEGMLTSTNACFVVERAAPLLRADDRVCRFQ